MRSMTVRQTHPNPMLDPAVEEMWHSLLDGTAKRKAPQDTSTDHRDRRTRITLATPNNAPR